MANYIIKKEPVCARIHFVKAAEFVNILKDYDKLHLSNLLFFKNLSGKYYEDVVKDSGKLSLFEKDFSRKIIWRLRSKIRNYGVSVDKIERVSLYWSKYKDVLSIEVDVPKECIDFLNKDPELRSFVITTLKSIYRYEGEFRFDQPDEIPF